MKLNPILWLGLASLSLPLGLCAAPVSIVPAAGSFVYSQNFDTMFAPADPGNVAASPTWADDSTIPAWYFIYAANAVNGSVAAGGNFAYTGSDGSAAPVLTLNSMGQAGSSDRAIAAPSTTGRGEQSGVVVFKNDGPKPVDLTGVSYNGEVLRTNSTANTLESIFVWYRKGGTLASVLARTSEPVANNTTVFQSGVNVTAPTSYYLTGWTNWSTATWSYVNGAAATPVNDSFPISASLPENAMRLLPGEFLAVRFSNTNDAGTDALLGVDDVNLSFTEATISAAPSVTNIVRNINGTDTVPTDDTVSFTLTVVGTGAVSPSGWTISTGPLAGTTGAYNTPVPLSLPIANFAAAGHTFTLMVEDAGTPAVNGSADIVSPWCVLTPEVSTSYNDGGTPNDAADDTISISVGASATFAGEQFSVDPGTGPVVLDYGNQTILSAAPGALITLTFVDGIDPACTAVWTGRGPAIIGVNNTTGVSQNIFGTLVGTAAWTIDGGAKTLTQNSATQVDHIVNSETINLATTGSALLSVNLDAIAGSSSGFEALDSFTVEVIVDGGAPVSILGNFDADLSGRLNGGVTSPSELPPVDAVNSTYNYNFSYLIPAAANSLAVRIIGNSNSPNETLVVKDIILSAAPEFAGYTFNATTAVQSSVGLRKLLAKITTPGGGAASITGVGASANGGTVSLTSSSINYTSAPAFAGTDTFTILILDPATGVAINGTVTVQVAGVPAAASLNQSTLTVQPDGSRSMVFHGIPGRSYLVQRSQDLMNWTTIQTVPADSTGVISYLDTEVLVGGSAFYRTAQIRP